MEQSMSLQVANALANQTLVTQSAADALLSLDPNFPSVPERSYFGLSSYTGQPHVEVRVCIPCRRNEIDFKLAVSYAVSDFRNDMYSRLDALGKDARVEWRTLPEIQVYELDHTGLHPKAANDDRCFFLVKVYCRCTFVPAHLVEANNQYLKCRRHETEAASQAA